MATRRALDYSTQLKGARLWGWRYQCANQRLHYIKLLPLASVIHISTYDATFHI